ncbi:MAG: SUMF1/EgtB/PvdO family nonheme iron enzyme [Candidatus Brocadiia bacterium]
MKQAFRIVIILAVVFGAWSLSVRLRFSPFSPSTNPMRSMPMPSFRPLSPYPEITTIPTDAPRPTVNPTLECPPGMAKIDNFCIDQYEFPNQKGVLPRNYVNWYTAQAECTKLGKRLCTEFEWVRACDGDPKGGALRRYSYGDVFIENNCNVQNTVPVVSGNYPNCRSAWGVYDMVGNVYEWVVPAEGSRLYTIGGAFGEGRGATCYKAGSGYQPQYYQIHIGFRCCK